MTSALRDNLSIPFGQVLTLSEHYVHLGRRQSRDVFVPPWPAMYLANILALWLEWRAEVESD